MVSPFRRHRGCTALWEKPGRVAQSEGEAMAGDTMTSGAHGRQGWRMEVQRAAAAVLLAAAVASQVSDELKWDSADFILVGLMLAAPCGIWELPMNKTRNWAYAPAAIVEAGTVFLL